MRNGDNEDRNRLKLPTPLAKRSLLAEMVEGVAAIKAHRAGQVTLRTHRVEAPPKLDGVTVRCPSR